MGFGSTVSLVVLALLGVGLPLLLFGYLFYRLGWRAGEGSGIREGGGSGGLDAPLRRTVDWAVVVVLVLVGGAGALAGIGIEGAVDRDRVEELVADGTVESAFLPEETLVDLVHTVAVWGGFGLVAAGLLLVAAGVGFAGYRLRLDRRLAAGADTTPPMASNALVGAVVTVAASLLVLSPVIGGAVAGYLQGEAPQAGIRAGALAGLFVAVPVVLVVGSVAVGLFAAGLVGSGLSLLAGLLSGLVVELALSAIGGFAGGYLGRPPDDR